ncbi:MAG: DUF2764 domain-containing protein [Spirochaetaceae bacterium]|nr:DUF2764 domain-containing protein [Spirochaetaceae bacterium]MCF7948044.1 DUF2764 domain-containing protein [Spirochaetia bacterium]MCF7950398.1 DUF2764 domain-containing protein [Spirochaetaceae bacterium]
MRQYYYVIATLPLLQFEDKPPLTLDELYYSCRGNIDADDLALLETVSLEPGAAQGNELLEKWYTWETSLRNELVKLRSQKIGVESEKYRREGEVIPGIPETAREAANQDSPLAGEQILNKARWTFLEELEVGHYFDLVKLMLYALKLQLLHRRSKFTTEQGREKFEQIYQHVRKDIESA